MISELLRRVKELLLLPLAAILSKGKRVGSWWARRQCSRSAMGGGDPLVAEASYWISWRVAVEANNLRGWRTVPAHCWRHIENYMVGGQYSRDLNLIMEQICSYVDGIPLSGNGMDAWVLDVDDTCDPFNSMEFKAWIMRAECPAIPCILELFNRLVEGGFKVILLTGRDEETLGPATIDNLYNQGFMGYHRLIMRTREHKGQSAVAFKSEIRKELVEEEGYIIWGNIGDQWSDLQGDYSGNRTFKIPNPIYFIP
ncbi:hypothetical protein Ancab_031360 [Ancistrocladus abbreviatus]